MDVLRDTRNFLQMLSHYPHGSQRARDIAFRQAVILGWFGVRYLLERVDELFLSGARSADCDVALVAPYPYSLGYREANDLLQRDILSFGQFARLLEHRFWDFRFDSRHYASLNFTSICAGVIASIPKASTPAKCRTLCVT